MGNNGHHKRQELIAAYTKARKEYVSAIKEMNRAMREARIAIARFCNAIPDEIWRMGKYRQN